MTNLGHLSNMTQKKQMNIFASERFFSKGEAGGMTVVPDVPGEKVNRVGTSAYFS
jgi:hypothetical protein